MQSDHLYSVRDNVNWVTTQKHVGLVGRLEQSNCTHPLQDTDRLGPYQPKCLPNMSVGTTHMHSWAFKRLKSCVETGEENGLQWNVSRDNELHHPNACASARKINYQRTETRLKRRETNSSTFNCLWEDALECHWSDALTDYDNHVTILTAWWCKWRDFKFKVWTQLRRTTRTGLRL